MKRKHDPPAPHPVLLQPPHQTLEPTPAALCAKSRLSDDARAFSSTMLSSMERQRHAPAEPLIDHHRDDLRHFYDVLMQRLESDGWADGWAAIKLDLVKVADELNMRSQRATMSATSPLAKRTPRGSAFGAAAPASCFRFVSRNTGPSEGQWQHVEAPAILCGRFGLCDCVVGHEIGSDGAASENLKVGRVQFIALRTATEVVVVDCWSKGGTRTVERSAGGELHSSCPGSRRLLLFGPSETFTLEVGDSVRITFSPDGPGEPLRG